MSVSHPTETLDAQRTQIGTQTLITAMDIEFLLQGILPETCMVVEVEDASDLAHGKKNFLIDMKKIRERIKLYFSSCGATEDVLDCRSPVTNLTDSDSFQTDHETLLIKEVHKESTQTNPPVLNPSDRSANTYCAGKNVARKPVKKLCDQEERRQENMCDGKINSTVQEEKEGTDHSKNLAVAGRKTLLSKSASHALKMLRVRSSTSSPHIFNSQISLKRNCDSSKTSLKHGENMAHNDCCHSLETEVKHVREITAKNDKCISSGRNLNSKAKSTAKNKAKSFECHYCHKLFRNNKGLSSHLWIHEKEKVFLCSLCPKRFLRRHELCLHTRTHTGERPYKCGVCGKAFTNSSALRRHETQHEKPREDHEVKALKDDSVCKICGKAFSQKGNLNAHLKIHSGTKEHECNLCERKFVSSGDLKRHARVHSKEKPYGCSECGKSFSASSSLTCHKRIHSGERPYLCGVCGASFLALSHLKQHNKIHIRGDLWPKAFLSTRRDGNIGAEKQMEGVTSQEVLSVSEICVQDSSVPGVLSSFQEQPRTAIEVPASGGLACSPEL